MRPAEVSCFRRIFRSAISLSQRFLPSLLRKWTAPRLVVTTLETDDLPSAFEDSSARDVRGGAIYDYLHLVAVRKARAPTLYTLNVADYRSFHRPGDPKIIHP